MRKIFYQLFLLHSLLLISIFSSAQVLDNTFGVSGKAGPFENNFVPSTTAHSMALDATGRILIAGTANGRFAVMRLTPDGAVDVSFGNGGVAENNKPGHGAIAIAVQPDGKIVLCGNKPNLPGQNQYDIVIQRIDANGNPDEFFGSNGVTIINAGNDEQANSIALQGDGKIVVGGYVNGGNDIFNASTDDFIVIRLNNDGSLDNTGFGGYKTIDFNGENDMANSIAIDANGKILVAGKAREGFTTNWDFGIARLNTNGTFDGTFNNGSGKHLINLDINNANDEVKSIAIQADGKILMAGTTSNGSNADFGIARIKEIDANSWGLDNDFDGDGKTLIDFNNTIDDAQCVLPQPDGKILVSGRTFNGNDYDFAIVRLNADGSLDNSFGTTGKYQLAFGTNTADFANAMLLQSGKLLVGNNVANNTGVHAGLIRLQFTPPPCPDADNDGYTTCAGDCEDTNPNVNPGATEICNGIDDDCDPLTIENCPTIPTVTINSITVNEAAGVANLTVSLFPLADVPVKLNYKTIDGTAQSKGRDKDFKAVGNGSITIPPGSGSAMITISLVTDNISETDEQFSVQLTKATGAQLGAQSTAIVTITESIVNPLMSRSQSVDYAKPAVGQKPATQLDVIAFPNPSATNFTINIKGNSKAEKIIMQVVDMYGRVIETRNVNANSTVRFGDRYRPGTYFVRIMQAKEHKEMKLIKLSD